MKRFFSWMLMLCLFGTITSWAQTMPFEAATSADDPDAQMYYIYQPNHQVYVKVSNDNILGNGFSGDQFIFVESATNGQYYIYDKSCSKFVTYTRTTDPGTSVKQTSSSAVQLVSSKTSAKTWRIVQEGSSDTFDIFPGEATGTTANSSTASWNFRGGKDYALNLYAASDKSSSWQIVAQLSAKLNCATRLFAEPGAKFMHKLVGNNKDDVQSVTGLPTGFNLNEDRPDYKYITGTAPAAGEYEYTLNLKDGTTETVRLTVSDKLTQPRPLMGVLTWNAFQNHIDENVIIKLAEGFEKFALKDAGYTYMCIDDQWAQQNRDASGHLQWRTDKFPNYNTLADRIHNMGLKIGIYSDAGSLTCSNKQPGSYGKETVDAQDFVNWGFDLLKYDFCNATGGTSAAAAEQAYTAMGTALKTAAAAKGKDFLFYMCEWGYRSPWLWGANTGATCWRATDDTRDYWTHPNGGVLEVLNKMKTIWAYQGVNRWNDADMMCIGLHGSGYSSNNNSALGYGDGDSRCTGLTMAEQRSQMALWCMFASPLTHSNNITNLDGKPNSLTGKTVTNNNYKEDLDIILNKELIALDQDPLGQAGEPIYDESDFIVFQKDMADGSIGLSITNLSGVAKNITVDFARLSALKSGVTYKMRDLWKHEYVGRDYTNAYQLTVNVPSHDTFVYRIQNVADEDLTWTEPVIPGLEGIENPEPEPTPSYDKVYNIQLDGTELYFTTTEVPDNQTTTYSIQADAEDFFLTPVEGVTNGFYITSTSGKKVGHTTKNSWDFSDDQSVWVIANIEGEPTTIYKQNFSKGFGVDDQVANKGVYTDKVGQKWIFIDVTPEPEPVYEWVAEYPETSTLAEPITYRIHNLGADEGGSKGHNNYVAYSEAYPGQLQHIGGTEEDREVADEFVFIEAAEGVYIYDKTVEKFVKWTANAEGGINWGSNSVSACRVVLVDTQDEANTWFIVNDENTEGRYDILPTATSQYGWSFMGGTDRAWVVLNLEGKTNRNCKWMFERLAPVVDPEPTPEPEPEPEPQAGPVQTSTIEAPVYYYIHNLGGDDGTYKGNDCYLGYNETYPQSLYHVDAADADKFIFIADGEAVKVYDTTIQKYVTYTSTGQGSINWAGNGSLTGCSVALTESAAEAKAWYIVADENTEGRYDVLPTATAANGWSFMGGIDRAWVLLNLEDKTNRNCKWVFELVETPDALNTLESVTRESSVTYDLSGRRVNTLKKGGVYIVGGKRVVM